MTETVSEWDREYMRRLGRYKAEAKAEQRRLHLAEPGIDRIVDSMRRSREYMTAGALELHLAEDDPSPLYELARRLGLIKS